MSRWWTYRFEKPYRERIVPSKLQPDAAIEAKLAEFEEWLCVYGNIKPVTIRSRIASIKLFLHTVFPGGTFKRRAISPRMTSSTIIRVQPRTKARACVPLRDTT